MADPQRDAAVAAWKANEDMRLYGGARRLKDYIVLPDDRIACGFAILAAEERGRRAGRDALREALEASLYHSPEGAKVPFELAEFAETLVEEVVARFRAKIQGEGLTEDEQHQLLNIALEYRKYTSAARQALARRETT